jgi:hypothetical protein
VCVSGCRNHGGDLSKVLAGIQVPPADQDHFESFLEKLGYPFTDETGNVRRASSLSLSPQPKQVITMVG